MDYRALPTSITLDPGDWRAPLTIRPFTVPNQRPSTTRAKENDLEGPCLLRRPRLLGIGSTDAGSNVTSVDSRRAHRCSHHPASPPPQRRDGCSILQPASDCLRHAMVSVEGAGGQHDNYGTALAAHPGKPQGRQITARALSPWFKGRPTRTRVLPVPRILDGRTIAWPDGSAGIETPKPSCRRTAPSDT